MAAVRCGIDEHVLRLFLKSALDDRLQILVFDLKLLEGEIIHIDDELIIAVLDLRDHTIQILELMLVYLDHTEALIIVLIQYRLDGG